MILLSNLRFAGVWYQSDMMLESYATIWSVTTWCVRRLLGSGLKKDIVCICFQHVPVAAGL